MLDNATTRLIVVPIIRDETFRILLCKLPQDRGVFPGQWALPGGGVEPGEQIHEALRREIAEELGVSASEAKPLFFSDGLYEKTFPNGDKRLIYMVFLIFDCRLSLNQPISLNPEFCEYAWVEPSSLANYDLNAATRNTFVTLALL